MYWSYYSVLISHIQTLSRKYVITFGIVFKGKKLDGSENHKLMAPLLLKAQCEPGPCAHDRGNLRTR